MSPKQTVSELARFACDGLISIDELMKQLEREYVVSMLERNDCNMVRTARAIGWHRNTISRKVDDLDINVHRMKFERRKKCVASANSVQHVARMA